MPKLRVILVLLSFIVLGNGEDLEMVGGGHDVKEFFDETSRHLRAYSGIFSKNMQNDMWIFVFIAAILTFGICFTVYFFDMVVFHIRRLINRFSNK